jgi:hypothetical protein
MEFIHTRTGRPLVRPQLRPFVSSNEITGTDQIGYELKQLKPSYLHIFMSTGRRIGQDSKLSITQAQLDSFLDTLDNIILDLEADLQSNPDTQYDPPYTRFELISSWPAGQLYHRHLRRQQEQNELALHVERVKEEQGLANFFIDPDESTNSNDQVKQEREEEDTFEPALKKQRV